MATDTKEIRELFTHDNTEFSDIREEGTTDMRYVAGDPWDPKERRKREKAGRPCLALDELSQYVNQAINDVRANKRAVKFDPVGNGANDETARFYSDKWREIENRSRAQIGYTTAFENCIQRSYGFVRVNRKYLHSRAVNQDLCIEAMPNPDLVVPDSEWQMPDLSDMKHCWVRESWSIRDFDRKWAKHAIGEDNRRRRLLVKSAPGWLSDGTVFVGEFWKIRTKKRKLLYVQPAGGADVIGVFEDEFERGMGKVLEGKTRTVDDPTVYMCLTNGLDILEEQDWPGKYIPIVGCFGKVLYVDEGAGPKKKILSMVRLARDPFMLYCYYRTTEAEIVGMTPKIPYFVYEGQLAKEELAALRKSLHEPVAVVQVKPKLEGTVFTEVLPFPQRQLYDPPIQSLEIGAEAARRAIQAAMGLTPLPTAAQRRNEKSGVALQRIEEQGQKGSYHFTDHYLDMLTQVGVIGEDLMDKVYDSARSVGVRRANDDAAVIRINDRKAEKYVPTKGDHLVTVSTGPKVDSERQEASEFADALVAAKPELFAIIGDLVIKLKNLGPIGDEMVERLEAMLPPPVQQVIQSKKEAPRPEQAVQALARARTVIQRMQQMLQQLQQQVATDQAKQQGAITTAKIGADSDLQKAKLDAKTEIAKLKADGWLKLRLADKDNATKIRIAEIAAATKGYETEAKHAAAHEAQALDIAAESVESSIERENTAHEAEREREHEDMAAQAQMGHEAQMAERAAQRPENGAGA